jgi:hypothetical protein
MKKEIRILIIMLLFAQCTDSNPFVKKVKSKKASVVGNVSIAALPNFHLQRDTIAIEVDTLGYFIFGTPKNKEKLKPVIETAEIFQQYPNGTLRETLYFCKAKRSSDGFKVTLHGSPNYLFNRIMTLTFVDSFVLATYVTPHYREGKIINNCSIRTDSLHVTLNKYPLSKGDIIRGHLFYKGWKECTIAEEKNRIVGESLPYEGYFECKVE